MWEVMNCCVCLHNIIVENERKYPVPLSEQAAPYEREGPLAQPNHQVPASWAAFIAMHQEIQESTMHQLLQDDLVEHIWRLRGNTNYFPFDLFENLSNYLLVLLNCNIYL
jgi:hypothetical protein